MISSFVSLFTLLPWLPAAQDDLRPTIESVILNPGQDLLITGSNWGDECTLFARFENDANGRPVAHTSAGMNRVRLGLPDSVQGLPMTLIPVRHDHGRTLIGEEFT